MTDNVISNRPRFRPRLLTRKQAAAYCGVSVTTLQHRCPVRPIALGTSRRLQRYDVQLLDEWIDTFRQDDELIGKDWLATLDNDDDHRSRQRN
jgi:hypothetical protein